MADAKNPYYGWFSMQDARLNAKGRVITSDDRMMPVTPFNWWLDDHGNKVKASIISRENKHPGMNIPSDTVFVGKLVEYIGPGSLSELSVKDSKPDAPSGESSLEEVD